MTSHTERLENFFSNNKSFSFIEAQGGHWSHFRITDGTVNLYAAEICLMFELMLSKGYIKIGTTENL